MNLAANSRPKEQIIEAVVTRADGTVENLGVIAYYHRNPVKNWWGNRQIRRREQARVAVS